MKKNILFVDDEPKVLQGLKRMLFGMRNEWDMDFVTSGNNALDQLKAKSYNVLVTDMRMPVMDGATLLNEVMQSYPQMVRIVLSGHSDRELILRSVKPAHQYLSKPCDAETLKKTVIRACKLRDLLSSEELIQIISKIDSLPSLPSVYNEIMQELQSEDPTISRVGEIIEKDIGMSTKILQLVNSAFFGLPRHISSPSQAVSLLGLDMVKSLVLTIHVFSQFDENQLHMVSIEKIWKHSMRVGQFAKAICRAEKNDPKIIDSAMIGGLLHDLGKLILAYNIPDQYKDVLITAREQKKPIHVIEKQILGTTHAEIGAYLVGIWGLPDTVVESLAYHHTPEMVPVDSFPPFWLTFIANLIDHKIRLKADWKTLLIPYKEFILENQFLEKFDYWLDLCLQELNRE